MENFIASFIVLQNKLLQKRRILTRVHAYVNCSSLYEISFAQGTRQVVVEVFDAFPRNHLELCLVNNLNRKIDESLAPFTPSRRSNH